MSNDLPKPPVFMGVDPATSDPNLKPKTSLGAYRAGVETRTAEARASEPKGPNLREAQATFDPKKDGARSLADIQATQAALAQPVAPEGVKLSEVTTKGLESLHAHSQAERENQAQNASTFVPAGAAPQAEKEEVAPRREPGPADGADDFELERLMQFAATNQQDAINNPKEREAVEKRLEPIDLIRGITELEFTQVVPIVPGKFEVIFRAITPEEDQQIRILILHMTSENAKLVSVERDLYSLLTVICSIVRLNTMEMPKHYTKENFFISVNTDVLRQKMRMFLSYPMPMMHALGVHSAWFDQRVRKAFTTVDTVLGNG